MTKRKDPKDLLKRGAKRTVSLEPPEMIALGEEMIEWVKKNDPLHLSQWYCIHKGFTDKQWDTMQQAPEFFPYYEKALKLVGLKYIQKDSPIEPSLKQRWQRVYYKDLRKEEDETARYNASLKNEEKPDTTPEQKKLIDQLCSELEKYRKGA